MGQKASRESPSAVSSGVLSANDACKQNGEEGLNRDCASAHFFPQSRKMSRLKTTRRQPAVLRTPSFVSSNEKHQKARRPQEPPHCRSLKNGQINQAMMAQTAIDATVQRPTSIAQLSQQDDRPNVSSRSNVMGLWQASKATDYCARSEYSAASKFDANADYAECPVCFDHLYKDRLSIFVLNGRKTCPHYFHKRCARQVMESAFLCTKACPVCRSEFDGLVELPDIRLDPVRWFRNADIDGNGRLDKREVLGALKAVLPADCDKIERTLNDLWSGWDKDGSGSIEIDEMLRPSDGLLAYVSKHVPAHSQKSDKPPSLERDAAAWFRFWDRDNDGCLDREEVMRALVKTFNVSMHLEKLATMRSLLNALWPDFDTDGSGSIDMAEFSKPDGLAETIVGNFNSHVN